MTRLRNSIVIGFAALLAAMFASGCVGEPTGTDYCPPRESIGVILNVAAQVGEDPVDDECIKDVMLYVFDSRDEFLGKVPTTVNTWTPINFPNAGQLKVIGWANDMSDSQTMTDHPAATHIDNFSMRLKAIGSSRAPGCVISTSPDDLFMGAAALENKKNTEERVTLPVKRMVGSMTVTVKGMNARFNPSGDISIRVGSTHNSYLMSGTLTGDDAEYGAAGVFEAADRYVVPVFNMLPQAAGRDNMYIELYDGTTLLDTVTADVAGDPITSIRGRLTNVLIDYTAGLSVTVVMSEWGDAHVWREYH